MMQVLSGRGFATEVLTGTLMETGLEGDSLGVLSGRGLSCSVSNADDPGPQHLFLQDGGVDVVVHRRPLRRYQGPDQAESDDLLRLLDAAFARSLPEVLVTFGADALTSEVLSRARGRGVATVFVIHNFHYRHPRPFSQVDLVLTPSRFAADYYRETLGLDCTVLPNLIDEGRVLAARHEARYATFVTPTAEKGVFVFARIAEELRRRRPDIPLLVVEGRATGSALVDCGLGPEAFASIRLMAHTPDPRQFWELTRVCLMPSLWWENQPLVAIEAMANGIPVIASDRGGLPETLGRSGVVLPLPDRITPTMRRMPTAEEVRPWIEAVVRCWDDPDWYEEQRRLARDEAGRWGPDVLEPRYARLFGELRAGLRPPGPPPRGRSSSIVLVPYRGGIDPECEVALRALENEGLRVLRRGDCQRPDVAHNELASVALHQGYESLLFVDPETGFDPLDALRLLARPEPVIAGLYARPGSRELDCQFDGLAEIRFGPDAAGLYPLRHAPAGFLRIRTAVLRRMIAELDLPPCDVRDGRGTWPFFLPLVVPDPTRGLTYLGDDQAFSYRLSQIGVTPMADTSIRLWRYGRYGFGWEDVGKSPTRHSSYTLHLQGG
jgi:glycosyltransferase involved in cell wall biosynthesis